MNDTASLEKALQATIERLVENRLESLRQQLTDEVREEISAALPGVKDDAPVSATPHPLMAELNQWVSRILQPAGQTEVMAACLQAAAAFSGRCALFVRRGDAFAFWRAERFADEAVGGMRSLSLPASQPGVFKELIETQQPLSVPHSPGAMPAILERALGACAESDFHLLPIVVQARVVGALYADAGAARGSVEPSALQIVARVTGLSLETAGARASVANRPAATSAATSAAPGHGTDSEESQSAKARVAESQDGRGSVSGADATAPSPLPGSFAAVVPEISAVAPGLAPPPDPDTLPESDRESHHKAHRFARVAVQDLLSYHSSRIEQGRQGKNLYLLLKEDIEKTRENYRQRFGKTPARAFDYLHYELVSKLAGNDPAALGAQYPGAYQGE